MHRLRWLVGFALVVAAPAHAETEHDRAEREIAQQMKQLVKAPPAPSARVVWEGVDSDRVAIDEARFMLDDVRLSYGELDELQKAAAEHRALYDGAVEPGKHQLLVHLTVHRTKVSLFEGLRRTTFKVSSAVGFPGQAGLQVTLKIRLHYDETQTDPKKRLTLDTRVVPHMLVAVDDAPMPELPHTVVAVAKEEPSAEPVPVVVEDRASPQVPERQHHHLSAHRPHAAAKHSKEMVDTAFHPRGASAKPEVALEHVPVGSVDAGAVPDAGPLDAGPLDAGPLDAGPLDAGLAALASATADAGATVGPGEASTSRAAIYFGLGGAVFLGLAALGLRRRTRGAG